MDEALGGHCDHIEVVLHNDGSVEVRTTAGHPGRRRTQDRPLPASEVVMTKLHAGGKFGGGSYAASGGLHGVGASVVNALSARLDVECGPGGQHPRDQLPTRCPRRLRRPGADAKFEAGSGLRKAKKIPKAAAAHACATLGRPPDLPQGRPSRLDTLHQRARQTAFLVPGLTIVVRTSTGSVTAAARARSRSASTAASASSASSWPPTGPSATPSAHRAGHLQGDRPGPREYGQMTPTEVTRELGVDVAMRWGTGYDTTLRSFVNIIATPKGGTHVAGFEQPSPRRMNEVLRAKKMLRVAEDDIVKDDALEGSPRWSRSAWPSRSSRPDQGGSSAPRRPAAS
ncbi:hypothetical protein GCM10023238_29420 [Streptomyces heliomycini]